MQHRTRKIRRTGVVWLKALNGGSNLRDRRIELKLSQRELGFISGCSHTFIGMLERDESTVTKALATQIAFRLGRRVNELFTEHEAPAPAARKPRATEVVRSTTPASRRSALATATPANGRKADVA